MFPIYNSYTGDPVATFLIFSFAVLVYVFLSLGLYTVAKRRGLRNYGLAWLPIANYWVLGCLADQYDNAHTGKNLKLRRHLLWLCIATVSLYIIVYVIIAKAAFSQYSALNMLVNSLLLTPYFMLYVLLPLFFTLIIFCYIAFYKHYRSCSPDKAVVLLVFSITFAVIIPFVLFSLRKSDKGMPAPPVTEPQ